MLAVRGGDLDEAARVAATRTPDMPLTVQDDMLADAVLAATTGVSSEERERIEAELRDDAELRRWLDAVAPGLRERTRTRVATEHRVAEPAEEVLASAEDSSDAAATQRARLSSD
jgi:hypothetical protein